MSVRREADSVRRAVLSAAGVATLLGLSLFGCGDWPPGKRGDATAGGTGQSQGTCSGTPLPCSALTTLQCAATSGCLDQGSCLGTPSEIGASCGTRSPVECNATPGCFWQTQCTGTPYGTCSASTQDSCLIAPGCVWTPGTSVHTGTGGSTAASSCQTYSIACTMTATCDCGYTCVFRCPACGGICGTACQTDDDCTAASAFGLPTPFCQFGLGSNAARTSSGICALSK